MRTSFLLVSMIVCCACAAESSTGPSRELPNMTPACTSGTTQGCPCAGGETGIQTCGAAGWNACSCPDPMNDFENPNPPMQLPDAGDTTVPEPRPDCSPGLYLGTYSCEISFLGFIAVPLEGEVAFNLSINETIVPGECEASDEFCGDLVISENGGTLFGIASGFYGFETQLEGALDCKTGEFRATGLGGRWGTAVSTDPNDPEALWTVEEPPWGMFTGSLMGTHELAGDTETIAGDWNLREDAMDINCIGPFTVSLQP